jgi:hypothetical protein
MCAIHFSCNLIESKPMGAYIIFIDSLASVEGLTSTGLSYRTNDMLFRTRRSLRYLEELGWMDGWMFSGWSSTPARGPEDGLNVHHGFVFDVTITYFCIRPGFTDETFFVLHVFG